MEETRYSKRRAAGVCYVCGKNPPEEGKKRCKRCIQNANEYVRLVRSRRRKKGLCPNCGKPSDEEHIVCERCRAKLVSNLRKYRKKKEAEQNGGSDSETEEK